MVKKSLKKKQTVIDDNRGQWAHPGKVTRINASSITMAGVPYPVLGVGADGQKQMMYPNKEYRFNQAPVTEYPMMEAKDGGWLSKFQTGSVPIKIVMNDGTEKLVSPEEYKDLYDSGHIASYVQYNNGKELYRAPDDYFKAAEITAPRRYRKIEGCVAGVCNDLANENKMSVEGFRKLGNLYGNAWEIVDNMYGQDIDISKDFSNLQVGDIVNLQRERFQNDDEKGIPAQNQHVGRISKIVDGVPYVKHYITHVGTDDRGEYGEYFEEPITNISKFVHYKPTRAKRPDFYKDITTGPSTFRFDQGYSPNTVENQILNAAVNDKENIQNVLKLNNEEYEKLARIAYGILGAESSFGRSRKTLYRMAMPDFLQKSIKVAEDLLRNRDIYDDNINNLSQGYGSQKESSLHTVSDVNATNSQQNYRKVNQKVRQGDYSGLERGNNYLFYALQEMGLNPDNLESGDASYKTVMANLAFQLKKNPNATEDELISAFTGKKNIGNYKQNYSNYLRNIDANPNNNLSYGAWKDFLGNASSAANVTSDFLKNANSQFVSFMRDASPLPENLNALAADILGGKEEINANSLSTATLESLKNIVRNNIAKNKYSIEYNDYGTSENSNADVGGNSSEDTMEMIKKALTDENYMLKTLLGQAQIVKVADGVYDVIDTYDFNDKGKTFGLVDDAKKRGISPYALIRSMGRNYGSQDNQGAKVKIRLDLNEKKKLGGWLTRYQDGSTVSADDEKYAKFVQTLPDNLKNNDDRYYNLRGYWESLGKPEVFDYSQPKEEDGFYHAFSRNPNTGEILKKPGHPTFKYALEEDAKEGYNAYISPDGTIYTFGKDDVVPEGFKPYKYKRGGVTWLNEYAEGGPTMTFKTMPVGTANIGTAADNTSVVMNTPRGTVVTGKANAPKIKTYPHSWKQVATDLAVPAVVAAAAAAPEIVAPLAALGEMAAPYVAPVVAAMESPIVAGAPAYLTANNMLTATMIPAGAKALSFLPTDVQSGNLSGFVEHALEAGLDLLPLAAASASFVRNAGKSIRTPNKNVKSFYEFDEFNEIYPHELDDLTNEEVLSVLDDLKKRLNTPEGKQKLKQLGITNKNPFEYLQVKNDINSYSMDNYIGINPSDPLRKQTMRHELEHFIQKLYNEEKVRKATKWYDRFYSNASTNKRKLDALNNTLTDIDKSLSNLELNITPEKNIDWVERARNAKKEVYPSDFNQDLLDNQDAVNYFDSGSMGREKSAMLAEVQQFMMDEGIIPKDRYVDVTPEMIEDMHRNIVSNNSGEGKYLRILNIMKPTKANYELIAKNLNKMLSIAPYAIPAATVPTILQNYQGLQKQKHGGRIFSAGGEKHKVYRKQSPTGNGEGVKGHIMVTHPTKDKGKWDTIDLTEKSGAKTVAQGVAATKKWHKENPEYQQGGPTTRYSYVLDDDSGNTVFDDNGNPIIINPTTNYTVPEWLPQVNITATKLPKPGGIPTSNASQSDASLAVDLALDAAQFVPGPLGTAASVVGMGKNLYEGDYVGAALDVANIATLGGAKLFTLAADLAKAAAKSRKAADMAAKAKFLERASNPNLWRTAGLIKDLSKVDVTGYTPTYKNEPKKAPDLITNPEISKRIKNAKALKGIYK